MNKIEIVYDENKKKLRAKTKGGWVMFPTKLRKLKAKYKAKLQKKISANGVVSFIVIGTIMKIK